MNKRVINIAITLISISLIGIIIIQYLWIKQAVSERETAFNQKVNEALQDIVKYFETHENTLLVEDHFDIDPKFSDADSNKKIVIISGKSKTKHEFEYNFDKNSDASWIIHEQHIETQELNIGDSVTKQIIITKEHLNNSNKKSDVNVTFSKDGSIKISDSVNVQLEFNIDKSLENIEKKVQSLESTFSQIVVELGKDSWNIFERIDSTQIQEIIRKALDQHGIALQSEYAIKNENDSIVAQSAQFNNNETNQHSTLLFPNRIHAGSEQLTLQFPNKQRHIFHSMALLLASSLLFTLILIIAIAYNIRIILRQKKISEIKSDFINNMTHEFKTPIATISLAVDSINKEQVLDSKEQIKYFSGIIKKENKRMNNQVENILQMALIDSKELEMNFNKENIHTLITNTIDHIKLQLEKKNCIPKTELNAENYYCYADEIHLLNAFSNLLDNALKYSQNKAEITIRTYNSKAFLHIEIEDNGIGIKKDELNKIFDKLYRIPTGNLHNVKGFGLGLAYVKAIVLAHKGSIKVSSTLKKGSTFVVSLPTIQ